MLASSWKSHSGFGPRLALLAAAWLAGPCLSLSAQAKILCRQSQPTTVQNQSEVIFYGALTPRDDSARETLYLKFQVTPGSDMATESNAPRSPYLAGLAFCRKSVEILGIGNASDAIAYSAFSKSFRFSGNIPGELDLHLDRPEFWSQKPVLLVRREITTTLVIKVEYLPGADDRVTVWLEPDLSEGSSEGSQSESILTRFNADASFDQLRLIHRGGGGGWEFSNIVAATSFADFVPQPLWQRPWFVILSGTVMILAVVSGVSAVERVRSRRKLALVERQKALAAERVRIAQDLHDDLGAKLTELVLLGELTTNPDIVEKSHLSEIRDGLRELHASLDQAVWSINPGHDSLTHLVEFVGEFAQRLVRYAPMAFELEVADDLPDVQLSATQRHNLLLAIKESLNNAVRHSSAKTIHLCVGKTDGGIRVALRDDGCGMNLSQQRSGDGLQNMRHRLAVIGGKAEIRSQSGAGTEVVFELPLDSGLENATS